MPPVRKCIGSVATTPAQDAWQQQHAVCVRAFPGGQLWTLLLAIQVGAASRAPTFTPNSVMGLSKFWPEQDPLPALASSINLLAAGEAACCLKLQ